MDQRRGYRFANRLFVALIVILPFTLFWRWVVFREVLFWGTLLLQFWPWRQLVKAALLQGQWPLWNPLLGNGTPLLANLQSAVFYPPNLLYLLMPVEQALTLSIILHLLLAGLFMYSYTRQLGLARFAATISALAYMFSGYIIGRTQFISMVSAAAWFPLLLLLIDRIVSQRKLIHTLGLAIVLALQLLAGHAQLWFYGIWLMAGYSLFRSWQAATKSPAGQEPGKPENYRNYLLRFTHYELRALLLIGFAVLLALFLAAVQLLPTLEFARISPRNAGAEQEFALTYSFWPWRFITLLAPDFFGNPAQGNYWGYTNYWEDHAYLGVLPFLLALIAIGYFIQNRRQGKAQNQPLMPADPEPTGAAPAAHPLFCQPLRVVPFFAGLIPVSLILALGWHTPVYLWVFETVPGFNLFQAPARLLIWYTLAMAVLAGIGAQVFQVSLKSRPHWRRFLAGCVAITIAGSIGAGFLTGQTLTFVSATGKLGVLLIIAITLLLIRPKPDSAGQFFREIIWRWTVVVFVAVDLLLAARPLIPTTSATVFDETISSAELFKAQPGEYRFYVDDRFAYSMTFDRYFHFQGFGPLEPDHWQQFKESLTPNFGVYAGLPSANNNDPLVVGHWQQLTDRLEQTTGVEQARLLSIMNVAYLVDAPQARSWPVVYSNEQSAIYRLPDRLPRAYFTPRAVGVKNKIEALSRLTSPDFEPHQEVIIITDVKEPLSDRSTISPDTWSVELEEVTSHRLRLQVQAPSAGYVVLTDTFYPGWKATVDGQPQQILQANLSFRAVAVEAGFHIIEFQYSPQTFTFGLWTSLLTCLIIIGIITYQTSRI